MVDIQAEIVEVGDHLGVVAGSLIHDKRPAVLAGRFCGKRGPQWSESVSHNNTFWRMGCAIRLVLVENLCVGVLGAESYECVDDLSVLEDEHGGD